MTYTQFITQFPEFTNAPQALVQAHLDGAALEIDNSIWVAKSDQGQAYLAAHRLATSPFGQNARLLAKDGTSTYGKYYDALVMQVAPRALVP